MKTSAKYIVVFFVFVLSSQILFASYHRADQTVLNDTYSVFTVDEIVNSIAQYEFQSQQDRLVNFTKLNFNSHLDCSNNSSRNTDSGIYINFLPKNLISPLMYLKFLSVQFSTTV